MVSSLIYDRGNKTKGSRRFFPWEAAISFTVLCEESSLRDLFLLFLGMFRIAPAAMLRYFPYMPRFMGKTLQA